MKKWLFTEAALLLLFLAATILMLPAIPEQYEFAVIDQELEKELQIWEEIRENNFLIKRHIFAAAMLTADQDENRIRLEELIAFIEKADKLIKESQIELTDISQGGAFEKLDKARKKLKEANELHKKALNGLSAILFPQPKMMPLIEA